MGSLSQQDNEAADSIHVYSLNDAKSKEIVEHTLSILRQHLPRSLPLYRRLQFGRFFDATCLLTNVPPGSSTPTDSPWFFAFVDRSCRPETEVWLVGSWEVEDTTALHERSAVDGMVKDLVLEIKNLGLPTSIHQDVLDAKAKEIERITNGIQLSKENYGGHMSDDNIMLWGAIHERSVPVFDRLGLLTRRFVAGVTPNYAFIWDVDALPPAKELPSGLRWGKLKSEHFALVRSRTQIPRQDRTLAELSSVGIFTVDDNRLVSWAFVGLDASLTTLHVEEDWRGRGLAKALTTKLFKEKMDMFWEPGMPKLAHGYVINGNKESEMMCRSLGGRADWQVYWLRVDLVKALVRRGMD